jgi:hypothetical protein
MPRDTLTRTLALLKPDDECLRGSTRRIGRRQQRTPVAESSLSLEIRRKPRRYIVTKKKGTFRFSTGCGG